MVGFKATLIITLILAPLAYAQTCSSSAPCAQGCCSTSGFCGFGPDHCGVGNCTSTCDAVAECGQYAPANQTNCPLNVCCSSAGYCGTTIEFCGTGCQNGCDPPQQHSCKGTSSQKRRIGYFESWAPTRSCDIWTVDTIDPFPWTHINYAFAMIDSKFALSQMNAGDVQDYRKLVNLKYQKPELKIFISVGGWSAGGAIFSQMASTAANRQAFIKSTIAFMRTYGFDGIDIDWEYPAAPDRGGTPADTENFVSLCKELKIALGSQYGLSITIPTSYWYLRGFNMEVLPRYVDFFNLMAYDIHGTWDGQNPYTQAVVQPHTNLTEINDALNLLWRNGVDPAFIVLGLGFYGRSFSLQDPACKTPGCPFSGGGDPGNCTQTSGILSNAEIKRIIDQNNLKPTLNKEAAIKYISWDDDQWVSYDDEETYNLKADFANSHCLSGLMAWAIDLDDPTTQESAFNINSDTFGSQDRDDLHNNLTSIPELWGKHGGQVLQDRAPNLFFWTECDINARSLCPDGTVAITQGQGRIYDADIGFSLESSVCRGGSGGSYRALCAQANIELGYCAWFGTPSSCMGNCPSGYIKITANTIPSDVGIACPAGRYSTFCCNSISYYGPDLSCPVNAFSNMLSGGLAPRFLNPLAVLDKPIQAGVNSDGCIGAGPDGQCKPDGPPDPNSAGCIGSGPDGECKTTAPAPASTTTTTLAPRGLGPMQYMPCETSSLLGTIMIDLPGGFDGTRFVVSSTQPGVRRSTLWTTLTTTSISYTTTTKICDGATFPDPCMHYRSAISKGAASILPCPYSDPGSYRPAVGRYNRQHDGKWIYGWTQSRFSVTNGQGFNDKCDRDEWPPIRLWGQLPGQYIRFLSRWQNKAVANSLGSGWKGICPDRIRDDPLKARYRFVDCTTFAQIVFCTSSKTEVLSWPVMSYGFVNMPVFPDDGLDQNFCYPETLTDDPGFALLTDDPWYTATHSLAYNSGAYRFSPSSSLTQGKQMPTDMIPKKRGLFDLSPDEIIIDLGNNSRRPTAEELLRDFGFMKCESKNCQEERKMLGPENELHETMPQYVEAKSTGLPLGADQLADPPKATAGAAVKVSSGGSPLTSAAAPPVSTTSYQGVQPRYVPRLQSW